MAITIEVSEEEKTVIDRIRSLKFGRLEVIIQDRKPVRTRKEELEDIICKH
jgi:hypothetical protein